MLLGASNLSIMFPHVIKTLRAAHARPLEVLVAKGPGRSYGQESKFFGKKFSGVLQCDLWQALDAARAPKTSAIVGDVGNDLAYETPVQRIVDWIETALDRLAQHDAQVVLNNIPIEALRSVGAARYLLLRSILFPSCTLPRREMLRRAEHLDEALRRLSESRKTPIFSGKTAWYGLDPIHPRRAWAGRIWQQMIGALVGVEGELELTRATFSEAILLHRLKPHAWVQLGLQRRARQPAARFADATTIALY
ncbi:MAG: hypothetical protein DCC67_12150 [Planctomycetota bacterium]|nr:MAG: hypothetical protein DCC67_12150 [Planctomycetota bacterium]